MTTLSKSISYGVHVGFQWCMYSRQVSVCIVHLRMHKERNHEPSIDSSSFTDSLDILCWPDWCSTIGRVKVRHQARSRVQILRSFAPWAAMCTLCQLFIGDRADCSQQCQWSWMIKFINPAFKEPPWAMSQKLKRWMAKPWQEKSPLSLITQRAILVYDNHSKVLEVNFYPLSWMLHLFLMTCYVSNFFPTFCMAGWVSSFIDVFLGFSGIPAWEWVVAWS